MAEAEESGTPAGAADEGDKSSKLPLILVLVNFLAIAAAGGMFYYTRILYKRPAITEETERKRLEEQKASPPADWSPGLVAFEPVTVNIEPQAGTESKLRYASLAFSVEIRDASQQPLVEQVKPVVMDKILSMLAHKPFNELTTVQGRYVIRTQILELINRLTAELPSRPVRKVAPKKAAAPAEGGHGAPAADAHGAPPAEGGEHGGGGGHGDEEEGHGDAHVAGPPIQTIFRDGLVSNIYFTQFVVQ